MVAQNKSNYLKIQTNKNRKKRAATVQVRNSQDETNLIILTDKDGRKYHFDTVSNQIVSCTNSKN